MKTLLFVIEHLDTGGAERSLVDLLQNLDYSKYDVDLLLFQKKGAYFNELPQQVHAHYLSISRAFGPITECIKSALINHDVFSIAFRLVYKLSTLFGRQNLRWARFLFKGLKSEYDCAIAYRNSICLDFVAYTFKSKKKYCWWHTGIMDLQEESRKQMEKVFLQMTKIVAVSKTAEEIVKVSFPSVADRTVVIPNMVSVEAIKKKAKEYSVEKDYSRINLVSVGRLSPEKNMELCIDVAEILRMRGIQFFWVLIGCGEEQKSIAARIDNAGLSDCMTMKGELNNPYPYVCAADIYVHPSLVESQGLAILEAMALSIPVVVVESRGPKEFIKNGIDGIITKNSAFEVASKIIELIENSKKREILSHNAASVLNQYQASNTIAQFDLLCEG